MLVVQAVTEDTCLVTPWLEDAPENHSEPWQIQMLIYVSCNDNKIPRKGT